MSNLVYPHFTPPQPTLRQYARAVREANSQRELAEQRITDVHAAGRRGMAETVMTGQFRCAAEFAAPSEADQLYAIKMVTDRATLAAIGCMFRGW